MKRASRKFDTTSGGTNDNASNPERSDDNDDNENDTDGGST
jgi:hypothetical protein